MGVLDNLNIIKSCKEDIKQAIADKGVDMTNVAFTEYATKISEIQTGGDYLDIRANMSTYYSTAESVPNHAFVYCNSLQSVNLPMCSFLGSSAFQNCSSLQSVNLPMCSFLGNNAFADCNSLQSVNLPMCSSVGGYVFDSCSSLTEINLPLCSIIENGVFYDCSKLSSVNLPNCISVGGSTFANCSSLTEINLPMCGYVGYNAFANCSSLTEVNLPICNLINDRAFFRCSSLNELDLRAIYMCDLSKSTAFSGTPFASGNGSIYVHVAHLSKFQNATNWTYFSKCLVGVGDPDKPLLSYDNGRVYGDTRVLYSNYSTFLSISKSNITSIDLPMCSHLLSDYMFANCLSLSTINLPNCVSIPFSCFSSCSSLTSVDLPKCEYVDNGGFLWCFNLSSVNLPMCSFLGSSAFDRCNNLTSVNLPICEYIGSNAFQGCSSLTEVNLPMCSYMGFNAFFNCLNISRMTVGTSISEVCVISQQAIPRTDKLESIFVPMSLVDAYKSAPIWSNFASKIYGI